MTTFKILTAPTFITKRTEFGQSSAFDEAANWLAELNADGWRPSPGIQCVGNEARCTLRTSSDPHATVILWKEGKPTDGR